MRSAIATKGPALASLTFEQIEPKDLRPGDLFVNTEPGYYHQTLAVDDFSLPVQIRTNTGAKAPYYLTTVYRLTIITSEDIP